jgi:hypothetical protein
MYCMYTILQDHMMIISLHFVSPNMIKLNPLRLTCCFCLICVKFPLKIAPRTLHTVREKFSNFFQNLLFHEGSNTFKSF